MNNLVKSVPPTSGFGIIGVFVREDPGSKDKLAKKGAGKAKPSMIISHQ
jgi:hypothetical protein